MLSEDDIQRYSRHILLPQLGGKGQEKIQKTSVLIVGAGGLGSPVALYLAASGVGRIGIVDPDEVELSNLQRQIIHTQNNIGEKKVLSARRHIAQLNKNVSVQIWDCSIDCQNGAEIVKNYDVVCDGSDNFKTRYAVNKLCASFGKPLISAAAQRFGGQLAHFDAVRGTGCYNCLYPQQGEVRGGNCSESGVFSPVVGVMGSLQATETLKAILGFNQDLGKLLLWDALGMDFTKITLQADPHCSVCMTFQKD